MLNEVKHLARKRAASCDATDKKAWLEMLPRSIILGLRY